MSNFALEAKRAREFLGIKPGRQSIYVKGQLAAVRDVLCHSTGSAEKLDEMEVDRRCSMEVIQRLDDIIMEQYRDISIIETTNINAGYGGMFILIMGGYKYFYFSSKLFHMATKNMYEEFEVVLESLKKSFVYREGEQKMPVLLRTRKNEVGRTLYGFPVDVFDQATQDLIKSRRLSAI